MRHVESRKGRSGFTLIELLVVVAIIALLISILLPSLARARELAKRTTCAANMSGIGKGLHTYASDGNQGMPISAHAAPAAGGTGATGNVTYARMIGSKRGQSNNPAAGEIINPGTTSQISTARNLWTLIRSGGSTPGSFVCPSSEDNKNDEDNPQDYWDFGKGDSITEGTLGAQQTAPAHQFGWKQISYGYQIPYGQYGKPSAEGDQRMVLAADKGPYGTAQGMDGESGPNPGNPTGVTSTSSPDDWRRYNSPNHGGTGDGEGQNVLYADSHADWSNKPTAGPALDNIYTQWTNPNTTVINERLQGVAPTATGRQTPLANTDGFIYP